MSDTAASAPGDLPDTALGLAQIIDAAISRLAAMPLGLTPDDQVLETVTTLEAAWRRADGANAALLVEVSDRELFRTAGHTSVKRYYAQAQRLGASAANRRAEVAQAIGILTSMTGEKLPPKREPVADGVADGMISAEAVHEIEQVMAKVPRNTPPDEVDTAVGIMATAAREMAPVDLRAIGTRLLAHLDPDGSLTDDTDRRRQRGLTLGPQDIRGMSRISGWLTPAARAKLEVLLDNWAAPGMNNPEDPGSPAGSVAELGEADRDTLSQSVQRDARSAAQRNVDALELGLDWLLGHEAYGPPDRIPSQLVITVDGEDLHRRAGVALTATGTMVPVGDLITLAADALPYLEVFKGGTRVVLDFWRGKRLATLPQRLAIFGSDLGCTRPGCTEPFSRTEAHHGALDFAKGGNTNVSEMTGACGPDNRNVGTKPGQWETAVITEGPDEGRIGWRPAGTDQPFATNPVHNPAAFLGSRHTADPPPDRRPPPRMHRTRPAPIGQSTRPPGSLVEAGFERLLAA
ncbi:HNH endonuclease signature motif containing protein [Gordonia crocea]|uniref:HNH endonuclease n=1 Tax=Gordonia crocea TaxID=589162 RepID=A0A7I9UX84_9ACTN|nr:HNH endonuclease signature motif containing protein [Gordonia crocea]GED97496.1 HNH endonuclease [Gordonia crocea]